MKRLITVLLACFTLASAWAQPNSEAKLWKTAKKEAKALEAAGWKADGSLPLENILFNHYKKLADENNQEIIGNVLGNTSVQTLNQAQQWAATMACISYSKEQGVNMKGRLLADVGAGVAGGPSADSFYEGYESTLEKEIRGELKKSFGIYLEKREGGIDYKAYYIVNEEKAHKARIRAMQMAMEESEFARENAEKISAFVRKGEF